MKLVTENGTETIFDGFDSEVVLLKTWKKRAGEALVARVVEACNGADVEDEEVDGFASDLWIALVDELTAAKAVKSSTLDN